MRCPASMVGGARRRRGAAMVEFAVVAPIFLFLVLGIIEFGRAFMVMETLTEAARIGARKAVIEGTTGDQVKQAVSDFLTSVSISGDTVQILVNDQPVQNTASFPAYSEMTVVVTVPANSVSWVPNAILPGGTLSGQFTLRRE